MLQGAHHFLGCLQTASTGFIFSGPSEATGGHAAEGGEPHSLEQHSSKLASQLAHLSSLLDRKGAINLQAFGASAFVPLMKVSATLQECVWLMKTEV
eukprot:scaffold44570_cov25-Tisochrysis_lutea.AAC.1